MIEALKLRSTSTRLHGAISQNAIIFILDAMRTWNLICHVPVWMVRMVSSNPVESVGCYATQL
jgi:hypothetical protein